MKKIVSILALLLVALGCGYGPHHLPYLYRQRDHVQKIIDDVVAEMVADEEWWNSLTPEQRQHWGRFLAQIDAEERDRSFRAIDVLAERSHGATRQGPHTRR